MLNQLRFLGLLVLSTSTLFAQQWIAQNAQWHYDWSGPSSGGFIEINYTSDTLINGQLCQKLEPIRHSFGTNQAQLLEYYGALPLGAEYTYSKGDTVFWWVNNSFHVLYNFAATVNDIWNLGIDTNGFGCSTSIINVDSVGTTTINNRNLNWQYLRPDSMASYGFTGRAIAGIGQLDDYLFPHLRSCNTNVNFDGPFYKLNCFSSDSFSLFNPSGKDCDFPLQHIGLKDLDRLSLDVYPIPAENKITVKAPNNYAFTVTVYATKGQTVYQKKECKGLQTIDCSLWPTGIYSLQINAPNQAPILTKISKR